ncbi:efflux RND transporter periplasmic adaptor subunit [Hymenobacter norwichensis]|uniref:efflux RND transporter periplasmic adaptor subunit n=1 Tax=Hymenobacter norwichensis TaxID=223903 RepID=UPI00146D9717|nr:efflux RND transporter periplasmic adaptor subunit [Hymenobacter norwichensis]
MKSLLRLASVSAVIIGLVLSVGWLRPWPLAATTEMVVAPVLVAGPLRHLPAASAGRVWELYVQPGSVVKRGQLLAKVAVPLRSAAQQQLEAQLRQALQRQGQLPAARSGNDSVVIRQANQQVAAIRQRLSAMPRQLTFVYVQAPANGTVVRLPVNTGSYIADSTTVISLGVAPPLTEGVAQN